MSEPLPARSVGPPPDEKDAQVIPFPVPDMAQAETNLALNPDLVIAPETQEPHRRVGERAIGPMAARYYGGLVVALGVATPFIAKGHSIEQLNTQLTAGSLIVGGLTAAIKGPAVVRWFDRVFTRIENKIARKPMKDGSPSSGQKS